MQDVAKTTSELQNGRYKALQHSRRRSRRTTRFALGKEGSTYPVSPVTCIVTVRVAIEVVHHDALETRVPDSGRTMRLFQTKRAIKSPCTCTLRSRWDCVNLGRMRLPYCRAVISSRELGPKKGVKRMFFYLEGAGGACGTRDISLDERGIPAYLAECH